MYNDLEKDVRQYKWLKKTLKIIVSKLSPFFFSILDFHNSDTSKQMELRIPQTVPAVQVVCRLMYNDDLL